ncbi:MAG: IS4 family transposase [Armatimonadetes bacterium]|nr:IS4 family transposase [Armatimonadota bacterium]
MAFSNMHEVLRAGGGAFTPAIFQGQEIKRLVEGALDDTASWHQRHCSLQAPLVMSTVLAMSLFRSSSITNVFKRVLDAIRGGKDVCLKDVTPEALYKARGRLGWKPLQHVARAIGQRGAGSEPTFFGFIPYAMDGVTMDVPNTPENETEFGRQLGSRGDAAFPQIKGVGLMHVDTHIFVDCVWGAYNSSELDGADLLLHNLDLRHVVFLDRRYTKVALWFNIVDSGTHLVHRLSASFEPKKVCRLGTGDGLIEVERWVQLPRKPGKGRCKRRLEKRNFRLIQYQIGDCESVQLLTDLLDPVAYPAREIAVGYHLRWEIEIALDEGKTHLQTVMHGTLHTAFRSQTPAGIYQEAWAMLATYNLVRGLMAESGKVHNIPPLEISFVDTLEVIRLALPVLENARPKQGVRLYRRMLRDIAACRLDRPRRPRWAPRVVKRKMSNFKLKRPGDDSVEYDYVGELRLVARRSR